MLGRLFVLPDLLQYFDVQSSESKIDNFTRGINVRTEMIYAGAQLFLDSPVWGIGFDSYRKLNYLYADFEAGTRSGHNMFFTQLSEVGLIGIFFIIGLMFFFREISIILFTISKEE